MFNPAAPKPTASLFEPVQKAATAMTNLGAAADKPITNRDYCDRCRVARAVARATPRPGSALYLCGHHLRGHEAALAEQGVHVYVEKVVSPSGT